MPGERASQRRRYNISREAWKLLKPRNVKTLHSIIYTLTGIIVYDIIAHGPRKVENARSNNILHNIVNLVIRIDQTFDFIPLRNIVHE